jgi:hypothetical protein
MAKKFVVLSWGMGVESTAIFMRWVNEPKSRDFDLEDLIVIVSQTGDEYPDTKVLAEKHFLPMVRKHNIRFVEVARGGHLEKDGIVIMQDTRQPREIHIDGTYPGGTYYKLSDELRVNGTVPQFGGEHKCALKFKAFVIETWLKQNLYDQAEIHHAFGYNSEEASRIAASEEGIKARNEGQTPIAFGFNADETDRIERSKEYNSSIRIGLYPLEKWKWNREACHEYIKSVVGNRWEKSACVYCPFNACTPEKVERMKRFPVNVAAGVMLEHVSLSMNPRGTLYAKGALIDILQKDGAKEILDAYNRKLNKMTWGLYRVRRVYSAKGKADRCVEKLETGPRDKMEERLLKAARAGKLEVVTKRAITYVYTKVRVEDQYPAVEDFFVAAPAVVETKARYGVERFERLWSETLQRMAEGPRVSGDVTNKKEIEAIWKAYLKNGGTMTFQQIELHKPFNLKVANGMNAYRIVQKYPA